VVICLCGEKISKGYALSADNPFPHWMVTYPTQASSLIVASSPTPATERKESLKNGPPLIYNLSPSTSQFFHLMFLDHG
jgi:hypothetical protein